MDVEEITRSRLNDDMLRLWAERGLTVIFVTRSVFEISSHAPLAR